MTFALFQWPLKSLLRVLRREQTAGAQAHVYVHQKHYVVYTEMQNINKQICTPLAKPFLSIQNAMKRTSVGTSCKVAYVDSHRLTFGYPIRLYSLFLLGYVYSCIACMNDCSGILRCRTLSNGPVFCCVAIFEACDS